MGCEAQLNALEIVESTSFIYRQPSRRWFSDAFDQSFRIHQEYLRETRGGGHRPLQIDVTKTIPPSPPSDLRSKFRRVWNCGLSAFTRQHTITQDVSSKVALRAAHSFASYKYNSAQRRSGVHK